MSAEAALGTDEEPLNALRLDYQLAHILVDEFQDTSEVNTACLKTLPGLGEHNHMNLDIRVRYLSWVMQCRVFMGSAMRRGSLSRARRRNRGFSLTTDHWRGTFALKQA